MEDLSLSKDFTIDDLKYGYLVELRDGRYALYMLVKMEMCLILAIHILQSEIIKII